MDILTSTDASHSLHCHGLLWLAADLFESQFEYGATVPGCHGQLQKGAGRGTGLPEAAAAIRRIRATVEGC